MSAKETRQNTRDGYTAITTFVMTIVATVFTDADPKALNAIQGLLIIMLHRGSPSV